MLRVDPDVLAPTPPNRARSRMMDGELCVVRTDADAVDVLVLFGLTPEQAADQVRVSYGPMAATPPG